MPSTPNFTNIDIFRCFLKLENEISRVDLVKEIGLGEGTIRSILDILKGKGLIESTRQGHSLTEKGKLLLKEIKENIEMKNFTSKKLFPKYKKTAILVKKYNNDVKIDYKLRDIAVKNNAEGALIFLFDKKLLIPDYEYKQEFKELNELFNYKNKNILVVTFADSYKISETAAIKVVEAVNDKLNVL